MASIRIPAKIHNGRIEISRQDLYGSTPAQGLRRRLSEVEKYPFVFSENMGLRPQKKLSFRQMHLLRMSMPAVSQCIDFLKGRAISFPFRIIKTDGNKKHNNFSEKRAEKVRKVLEGPNQFGQTYRMMLMMFLDNLLEWDLGTIEKENYPLGGVRQLAVINSSKIRPNPENFQGDLNIPAYFEFDSMMLETKVNEYRKNEIIWANLNPQAGSFYGFSPIEVLDQIIVMNIYSTLHGMKIVHPHSEKGGGIVYLGNVSGEVRKEFEERYRIFRESDPGRPMFTAGGDIAPTYLNLRDKSDLKYESLEQSLSEIVASSYGLSLQDIGRQSNKGSAGTAEVDDAITNKSAIIPRMLLLEDIFTVGVVQETGGDDLKLQYVVRKEEPLLKRVQAGSMAFGRGAITLNEFREMIDETYDNYDEKIGNEPVFISGNNVLKVKDIMSGKAQKQLAASNPFNPNPGPVDQSKEKGQGKESQADFKKRTTARQTDRGVDQSWQ